MSTGQTVTQRIDASLSDSVKEATVLPAEQARWFAAEVHPHQGRLAAYLRNKYPAVSDVEDVVQESFLRIWKARFARPIASSRSFLFKIADHLAIDIIRRGHAARIVPAGDLERLEIADDSLGIPQRLSRAEKVDLLSDALASLPERCRAIMMMKKFEERPLDEIAAQMGISVRTAENQINRGTKLLARYLQRHGVESFHRDER